MSEIAELRDILAAERACLTAGRLSDLAPLLARKVAAIAAVAGRPPRDRQSLAPLLAEARANDRLLAAAVKGVKAAAARLQAIRAVGQGLTAYTADGRSVCHRAATGAVERRA